jgi:GH25 family lysozyme M1 (1,4-beta-N-acetylmuramidase)
MGNHYGVDVSSNNVHPIDWSAVGEHMRALGNGAQPFAIVKVSQGTGYLNGDMAVDVAQARAAGFAVAGYLMDQGNADVSAELALFKAHTDLPLADDIELPEGLSVAQYIVHSEALMNLDPLAIFYLNQSEVAEGFLAGKTANLATRLWLAEYNNTPGTTKYPCLVHQYADNLVIPGTSGVFDANVWLGEEDSFDAYFRVRTLATTNLDGGKMIAITHTGEGYWILKDDGSIWSFGDAPYLGGCNVGASSPFGPGDSAIAIAAHPSGYGYLIESALGAVYAFGACVYAGGLNNLRPS